MVRRLTGTLGLGASWGVYFALFFLSLGLLIGYLDPASIDPGESPWLMSAIGFVVGAVSGLSFAVLLVLAESRRAFADLAMRRLATWGAIGGATFPLLTGKDVGLAAILGTFGALCAVVTLAVSRRAHPGRLARIVAGPFRATVESNG